MKFLNYRKQRKFLNNMLRRKPDWIGHILRRKCLHYDVIEGQMMEVKGEERSSLMI